MGNVIVSVDVKCKVCGVNDKTDPQKRPPREGSQYHRNLKFQTMEIDEDEWVWRFLIGTWIMYYGIDFD